MCTILAFHRNHEEFPLLVAANRDELYARPATDPCILHESPRVVGGRDGERGGTWMGLSERGVFVGITNQRTFTPPDKTLRSRGEIVMRALTSNTAREAARCLEDVDAREYNEFNLMVGDGRELFVGYARRAERKVEIAELEPGLHVLTNDRIGSLHFPKAARAARAAAPLAHADWNTCLARLPLILADHHMPDIDHVPEPPEGSWLSREMLRLLYPICIHTPGYGTRSATIAAVENGRAAHYLFAGGPPCTTPFTDYSSLLPA